MSALFAHGFGDGGSQLLSGPHYLEFLGRGYSIPANVQIPGDYQLRSLVDQMQWLSAVTGSPLPLADYSASLASGYDSGDFSDAAGGIDGSQNNNQGGSWFDRNFTYPIVNMASPAVDVAGNIYDTGKKIIDTTLPVVSVFGAGYVIGLGVVALIIYSVVSKGGGRRR